MRVPPKPPKAKTPAGQRKQDNNGSKMAKKSSKKKGA